MKNTIENFSKIDNVLFNILIGAFIANILTLAIIIFSDSFTSSSKEKISLNLRKFCTKK